MNFYEVLRARRSIRSFDRNREIPEAALERIMKAVQCAPSACNRQPWRFEIVFNPELREKIGACYPKDWLLQAPAIVVAMGDYSNCWKRLEGTPSVEIDIGIAMEHLVLAATAEGLATCWVCAFEKARLNQVMGVKDPWSVEAIAPLGYGTGAPHGLPYKPMEEIFKVRR
ncbi:Protein DrgA [bioreactor metagenome]|uniref:Protein DrgA n=1 Tax=bioreactor metagenome TaxID=1076179 RepID=A0A645C292_9ZZZZ